MDKAGSEKSEITGFFVSGAEHSGPTDRLSVNYTNGTITSYNI